MIFFVFLANIAAVATAVIIHYECLYRITMYIPKMHVNHRYRIVVGVCGSLVAQAVEIWVFAIALTTSIKCVKTLIMQVPDNTRLSKPDNFYEGDE